MWELITGFPSPVKAPLIIYTDDICYRSGYNMLHFTPIQRLGHSKSAYSLADQHKLNTTFTMEDGGEATFEDVKKIGNNQKVNIHTY